MDTGLINHVVKQKPDHVVKCIKNAVFVIPRSYTASVIFSSNTTLGLHMYMFLLIVYSQVFEMNPSMLRTTKTIMETVHESTQSQRVLKGKGISIDQMFDNMDKGGPGGYSYTLAR